MIKSIISDFSRTILFPKDLVTSLELNGIHKREIANIKNKNVYELNNEDLNLTESVYPAYNFYIINHPLLNLFSSLKHHKELKLYVFTSGFVQTHPDFKEDLSIFDQIVSISDLNNISKRDSESYKLFCEKFDIVPEEAIYIDNEKVCLDAASQIYLNTILFPEIKAYTTEQFNEKLREATDKVNEEITHLIK